MTDSEEPSLWRAYGFAVAVAIAGVLLRLPFVPVLQDKVPYITFFLATAASATYGGFGPGMLTTVLGALLAGYFVVPPVGSLIIVDAADAFALALFLLVGGIISFLGGRLLNSKLHEAALRLLFQQTFSSIGDAVISTDDQKRIRMLNPVAEKLTGWTQAEAKGRLMKEVFRIVREGSDEPVEDPIEKVFRTGAIVGLANHTELIAKDGRRIAIDDSGAPVRNSRGVIIGAVLVFRDIIERRKAELELERSERRSRNILNSISDAYVLLDYEYRIVHVNPAAEKILRLSADAVIGSVHWELFPATLGSEIEANYRRAMTENVSVTFDSYYEPWRKWFEIRAYPSEEGLAVYFRDITERKISEARLLKLHEDLEQFTFASSHDLQEPLRMMTIYAQMLEQKLDGNLDEEARLYISHMVNGGMRVSRMIDGLLQFTRLGEDNQSPPAPVHAGEALAEALHNLHISIQEKDALIIWGQLPFVIANHEHLSQLFQNLVGNALKYSRSGVAPEIKIDAMRSEGEWIFAVQDNGIGIPQQHHTRIFVPFKRLHSATVTGAGIGLATCKRIVERYGGRIWLESKEGIGTTFYFALKAAEQETAANL